MDIKGHEPQGEQVAELKSLVDHGQAVLPLRTVVLRLRDFAERRDRPHVPFPCGRLRVIRDLSIYSEDL